MGIQTNDLKEFDRQAQTWLVIQKAQQEELRDSRSIIQNLELKIGRGKKIILVATPIIFGGGIYLGYQMAKKKD